jgi:DNA-binding GntR family transcriptional regulator
MSATSSGGDGSTVRRLGNRPQISDEAAAYIRELIMSGQARSGEYLRPERLAGALGVSVTPVREALLALRGEGFVQLIPHRGFVVMPLSREDVLDLYVVQAGLAAELAARAAAQIDPAGLAELDRLQASLEAAAEAGDNDRIEVLNHYFHRQINLVANAPKLAWFLSIATRYAPRRFYPSIHGWRTASVEDHYDILAALRRADADGARLAMNRHIMHAGELLAAHLDELAMEEVN